MSEQAPLLHAIIPAAGRSRRMGTPKLLLPLAGRTVLSRLLEVLDIPAIAGRYVVVRADDEELAREAARCGATVIRPAQDPEDMRASVQVALRHIREIRSAERDEGWLLVPADHPVLDETVLKALVAHWGRERCGILVPTHAGRRGHPTLFRWEYAEAVFALPANCGVNRLLAAHEDAVRECPVETDGVLLDLDTPADYRTLRERAARSRARDDLDDV